MPRGRKNAAHWRGETHPTGARPGCVKDVSPPSAQHFLLPSFAALCSVALYWWLAGRGSTRLDHGINCTRSPPLVEPLLMATYTVSEELALSARAGESLLSKARLGLGLSES